MRDGHGNGDGERAKHRVWDGNVEMDGGMRKDQAPHGLERDLHLDGHIHLDMDQDQGKDMKKGHGKNTQMDEKYMERWTSTITMNNSGDGRGTASGEGLALGTPWGNGGASGVGLASGWGTRRGHGYASGYASGYALGSGLGRASGYGHGRGDGYADGNKYIYE